MDALIAAAARALAAGDALAALDRVALREDPPALALRGIAMAQLGEYPRARDLLRRAARRFGRHERVARARCVVAESEVALAMRDFGGSPQRLGAAADTLAAHGDRANALHARLLGARRLLLLGRVDAASAVVTALDLGGAPPALATMAALIDAELALRALRLAAARDAVARAGHAAALACVPALEDEVAQFGATFTRPAARRIAAGIESALTLDQAASLLASGTLVIDACRRGVRAAGTWLPLTRRPVLFALALALARHWPGDVARHTLIAAAFNSRRPDDTHRARLRVEIGRLRTLLAPLARIEATARGFVLEARSPGEVVVLAPPIEGESAALVALLADGAAWSTSALALALDTSQRSVQRALAALEAEGRVRSTGRGRAQRWLSPPLAPFTTILLLPAALALA